MALSGTTNKVSFSPSNGTTTLVFTIPFFDATTIVTGTTNKFGDIKVTRLRSGTETALVPVSTTPGADQFKLTATNNDPAQGGTVTIAASTAGDKFTIERDVAYTQEYDLQEGATIDPTALNKAFDRAVAQNQQQNDLFTRTIEFPITDDAARTYTVGTETDRANKALGFDNNGNVTQINIATEGGFAANADAGLSLTDGQLSAKVDNVTTQFSGGNIVVKQVDTAQIAADAITATEIDNNAVTTASIVDDAVTYDKVQHITTSNSVLGNTSTGAVAERALVGDILLDEDNMASNSAVKGSTQQAIKAYIDAAVSAVSTDGSGSGTNTSDGKIVTIGSGTNNIIIKFFTLNSSDDGDQNYTFASAFPNNVFSINMSGFAGTMTNVATTGFTYNRFDTYSNQSVKCFAIGN